jgi:23S rRNA (guanine2445-N2)-methyltransferase / 23S rRNA (guanine2069-N7)-methyltransferase
LNQRTVSEESKTFDAAPGRSGEASLALFATAPRDLVSLLRRELEGLGARHLRAGHAGVRFRGDLGVAYRACLWSRLAGRILLPLKSFRCATEEQLYSGVKAIQWAEHLGPGGTLAVDFTSTRSRLHHTRFGAQRVKDAVVDQLRERTGERPSVDRERPSVRINAHVDRDVATIAVDLSGTGLHRRGYRRQGGPAPLKENVAAAMLIHAGWPDLARAGKPLLDPMCGAGTLVIEGALMAGDVAPGLTRDYFGLLGWRGHDADLWQTLLDEADQRRRDGLARLPAIAGFDVDAGAVERARDNLEGAGLEEQVRIDRRAMAGLASPWPEQTGLLVCNPPYGERLGDRDGVARLYTTMGEALRQGFPGWRAAVLAAAPTIGSYLGLRPGRSERLDNGPLPCRLTRYEIPAADGVPALRDGDSTARAGERHGSDPNAAMFANRLRKNLRQIGAWARREGIDCYRLYDADMPEYAFAIDVYRAEDTWIVAQEYQAPATIPEERAAARRGTVLSAVADLFEVPAARVVLKTRRRHKGGGQYERVDHLGRLHEVQEHGCRLLVNFSDRLDTGLFLDHRQVRKLIRDLAPGRRFLNLFAYTGAATVQAAMGGAVATTSVDISRRYLEWARQNLVLNGFSGEEHVQVRADCLAWLADGPADKRDYDIVLMDVPTFSNSTGMEDTLDVQRDHGTLIRQAARHLAPEGVLIFSNHLKRFRMDGAALGAAGLELEDITRDTVPRDFARNPRVHHCWRIRHRRGKKP